MRETLNLSTRTRKEVIDLTDKVNAVLRKAGMRDGLCSLFLTHRNVAHHSRVGRSVGARHLAVGPARGARWAKAA